MDIVSVISLLSGNSPGRVDPKCVNCQYLFPCIISPSDTSGKKKRKKKKKQRRTCITEPESGNFFPVTHVTQHPTMKPDVTVNCYHTLSAPKLLLVEINIPDKFSRFLKSPSLLTHFSVTSIIIIIQYKS
jgi:hypothetical protein